MPQSSNMLHLKEITQCTKYLLYSAKLCIFNNAHEEFKTRGNICYTLKLLKDNGNSIRIR